MSPLKISFAGAGNVAGALGRTLRDKNNIIEHIVSRNKISGLIFAKNFNASWSDNYIFPDTSDLIFISVPDKAISDVIGRMRCNDNAVVVHTAGSIGIELFEGHFEHYGVFYPLQSFSSGRVPDLSSVPIFIEASDSDTFILLKKIAESVSIKVYNCDSEHRRMLHLAAVFASNFTNHMLTMGKEISDMAGFPFEVFEPLLTETIKKAADLGPENSQTGPAFRHDINTINKHLELLSDKAELRNIYDQFSRSIMKYYKKF